jgi:hypothetical protein
MAKPPKPRRWTPMNPQKYEGDPTNIICRSSWEVKFFNWCDSNPLVLSYSSEEVVVPYRCPTDDKLHRYFVDAKIKLANKNGPPKTYLIEIKPMEQCEPPKMGKNRQRYITEAMTFVKNQAKWKAATQYAIERGWEFKVLTQKDLGL